MTKKHKLFAFITIIDVFLFVIFDSILKGNGLGLRNTYYNIMISLLVYPILILMSWFALVFYQKHLKKRIFTRIWGIVILPIMLIGLFFIFTYSMLTIKEVEVEIGGVQYVYNDIGEESDTPNVYYEVVNKYLHKYPYAMIDLIPEKPQ